MRRSDFLLIFVAKNLVISELPGNHFGLVLNGMRVAHLHRLIEACVYVVDDHLLELLDFPHFDLCHVVVQIRAHFKGESFIWPHGWVLGNFFHLLFSNRFFVHIVQISREFFNLSIFLEEECDFSGVNGQFFLDAVL